MEAKLAKTAKMGRNIRLPRSGFSAGASCEAVIPPYQQIAITADMIGGKCPEVAENIRLEYSTVLSINLHRLTDTQPFSFFSACCNESRVLTVEYGQTQGTGNCTAIEIYITGKAFSAGLLNLASNISRASARVYLILGPLLLISGYFRTLNNISVTMAFYTTISQYIVS